MLASTKEKARAMNELDYFFIGFALLIAQTYIYFNLQL